MSDFDYQRYLAGREWAVKREAVRKRSRNHCEHCFLLPQQAVHHLTYERIGHEDLRDLMAVCHSCHEWLSGKSEINPLDEVYIVTPGLSSPSWTDLGYEPIHFLIPFALRNEHEVLSVRQAFCRGSLCVWCTYQNAEWMFNLSDLSLDIEGWSGRRQRFRDG